MEKQEIMEQLDKLEQARDKEFIEKYNELCKEFDRELLPQMILTAGFHPVVQFSIKRTK